MYQYFKIESICLSGRKRFMEILHLYLIKNRHIIDNHTWFINTLNQRDIDYCYYLKSIFPDFYKVEHGSYYYEGCFDTWAGFRSLYLNRTQSDTIYIKLDDDICFMSSNAIENLIKCRTENLSAFIVMPMMLNNENASLSLKDNSPLSNSINYALSADDVFCESCNSMHHGFFNPQSAVAQHNEFLNVYDNFINTVSYSNYSNQLKPTISCICWFGYDFEKFNGVIELPSDEIALWQKAIEYNREIMYCGNSFMVHFAAHTQHNVLEKQNNFLSEYKKIAVKNYLRFDNKPS